MRDAESSERLRVSQFIYLPLFSTAGVHVPHKAHFSLILGLCISPFSPVRNTGGPRSMSVSCKVIFHFVSMLQDFLS